MTKLKNCKHCEYFKPNDPVIEAVTRDVVPGTCLRYPPTPMLIQGREIVIPGSSIGSVGINPPVHSGHVCGEWLLHSSIGKPSLDAIQSTKSPGTGAANDHD